MVLINEKKFACATCIKGHRVSGCTHTDRPLFEIKKKGRPSTQCKCCKDKRKSNSVHNACVCGDSAPVAPPPDHHAESSRASGSTTPIEAMESFETRKGQPGSSATFPNGLKDVHEMNAAVEALTGFAEDPMRSAERSVAHLLNPCTCKHTGICKCCEPKRPARKSLHSHTSSSHSHSSGRRTPDGNNHTEQLVEMYKARAPSLHRSGSATPSNPSPISSNGHSVSAVPRHQSFQHLPVPDMSPSNPHHPAHTSKHVHKTKLYSPYVHSAAARHTHTKRESLSRQGATSPRPLPLKPLGDMPTFLGALFQPDGTVSTEISRHALGLPGIHTFDALAAEAAKSEPMDWEETIAKAAAHTSEDVDMPLAFPTVEDAQIGACTCGEDCRCPGCITHPNASGDVGQGGSCADAGCKSSFDCSDHLHIPAGMTSIEHLLATAAANVPAPSRKRTIGLSPLDTSIAPPSAGFSPDAAANSGYVQLKPLECCNGRCQCRPGECVCEKDCCGCCVRCACGEDAPTPTADTYSGRETPAGGCCSASNPVAPVVEKGSCCETGRSGHRLSLSRGSNTLAPPGISPNGSGFTPPRLSPSSAGGFTFNPSPYHSPLLGPSSSSGGSNHHSPMLSQYPVPNYPSSHSSPVMPAENFAASFNMDSFQLPSPGFNLSNDYSQMQPTASDGQMQQPAGSMNGDAPLLRRAASISNGHAYTQSTSSLAARRATVTAGTAGGASIHRSASTGKQASKALALHHAPNHPHVRPIAPRPTISSLAPPKSGASSSRGISPSGRRRSGSSAHNSRAPSPGPSDPHANLGSAHRTHGSVDHADPSSAFMPIQGLPIVTTSAPDETSQQVSFDPAFSLPGLDDPDMAALLSQLMGDDTFGQGGSSQGGGGRGADDGAFSGTFDFLQHPQHQQQSSQSHIDLSGQAGQAGQEELYNMLLQAGLGSEEYLSSVKNGLGPGANEFGGGDQGQSGAEPTSDIPLFPGFFATDLPTYLPSYSSSESSMQGQHSGGQSQSSAPASSSTQANGTGTDAAGNPNIIDLSKPLNAEHLDRIIKALQMQQQQQQQQGQSGDNNSAPNPLGNGQIPPPRSMPPPPVPPIQRHTSDKTQQPAIVPSQLPAPDTSNPFDPSILNTNDNYKRHQPSFSMSSFDSFLAPPPSDSSGSGSGHSTLMSGDGAGMYALEGEDVFEKYILDNPGEGLDLSLLDLGEGGGLDMGEGGSKGTGGGADGVYGGGVDDWLWTNNEGNGQ